MRPEIHPAPQPLIQAPKTAVFLVLGQRQAQGILVECLIATALQMAAEG
jgi:hypothetical protein